MKESAGAVSLRTSLVRIRRRRRGGLNNPYGPVGGHKRLIRHAANVGFTHFVDSIDLGEQLSPITVTCLIEAELERQSLIAAQAANQVGFGAGLDHLQFVVADVFFLDSLDLDVNGVRHLLRLVAGKRECIEGKKMRVLVSRKSGKAS